MPAYTQMADVDPGESTDVGAHSPHVRAQDGGGERRASATSVVFDQDDPSGSSSLSAQRSRLGRAATMFDRVRMPLARFARLVGMHVPGISYTSLNTTDEPAAARRRTRALHGLFGGGTSQDGVFSNLNAKPDHSRASRDPNDRGDDDDLADDSLPPTYDAAAADAAPTYWESTVFGGAYASAMGEGGWTPESGAVGEIRDMLVNQLPLGSIVGFMWNMILSAMFQFVGFFLTFFLYTTHAAKLGSRTGLGITLFQYGMFLLSRIASPAQENNSNDSTNSDTNGDKSDAPTPEQVRNSKLISYAFVLIGLFLMVHGTLKFVFMYKDALKIVRNARSQQPAPQTLGDMAARPGGGEPEPTGYLSQGDTVTQMNSMAGRWRDMVLAELGFPVARTGRNPPPPEVYDTSHHFMTVDPVFSLGGEDEGDEPAYRLSEMAPGRIGAVHPGLFQYSHRDLDDGEIPTSIDDLEAQPERR